MIQIIPFGVGQFMVRLFSVSVPDEISFNAYHEGTCRISWQDGRSLDRPCILHRPSNRRNVFGIKATDELILLLQTDLTEAELARCKIAVAQWNRQLSEADAKARLLPT